ncbi:neuronal acetylcholine receptor subunit beta-4-like isoform X2 [Ornithodoros turicata]|uniref:neuronal acetylcholine receptor subunit beta-4-like isoform X2 n=1 Tax=Ornithodoros turicata TaxID=34597 RepID=UPI0031389585
MKEKPNSTRTYDEDGFRKRAACLCVRRDESELLLVSSSSAPDRWIVPGGGLEPEEEPSAAAMREVMEEAGVRGHLGRFVGTFENLERKHRTMVFILEVTEELEEWEDSKSIADDVDMQTMKRLRSNLTDSSKYDKNYQPKNSRSSETQVNFTVYAKELLYMEPGWRYISMTAFVCMHWVDEGLSWTPQEYGGATGITFGKDDVWTPSININSGHGSFSVRMFSAVKADNRGNVRWCPLVYISLRCTMNLVNYPFDEQRCSVNVSSWTPHGYKVKLIGKVVKSDFTASHPNWEGRIESMQVQEAEHPEEGRDSVLRFTLLAKRRSANFQFYVVLPCTAVSILTILIFWLPPSSGKKITLGLGNIILVLLIMMDLRYDVEITTEVSKLERYLGSTCVAIAVATMVSVLVINLVKSPMVFRPPAFLVDLLSGVAGRVFFLCPLPPPRSVDHEALTDATTPIDKQDIIAKQEWFLVAQAIDRVTFVLYAIYLLAYHA